MRVFDWVYGGGFFVRVFLLFPEEELKKWKRERKKKKLFNGFPG